MQSGTGPIHWVAPEFFCGHYTEKADIFSLGTLLFAILERDYIVINGKAIYGAFVSVPGKGKYGVGFAMENLIGIYEFNFQVTLKDPTLYRETSMSC